MNDPVLYLALAFIGIAVFLMVRIILTRGQPAKPVAMTPDGMPPPPKLSRREAKKQQANASGLIDARDLVVDMTSAMVENRSGRGLQNRLEQSGSQLRSGEWVLLTIATALVLAGIVYLPGGIPAAILVMILVPVGANTLLNRNITKRQEAFADQLPDFLQNLSSALRSGQSLPQAIGSIAPDIDAPAGDELRRVVIENRIGRDLIESFNDLAGRMNSIDFDWVVRAIEINYRTGGDLSMILRRLDATIRARNHVAGTVRSLSAEGKISGMVLAALPPLLMLAVQVINPEFLLPLFQSPLGVTMLVFAATQLTVGTFWLSRMAKFKF